MMGRCEEKVYSRTESCSVGLVYIERILQGVAVRVIMESRVGKQVSLVSEGKKFCIMWHDVGPFRRDLIDG